MTKLSLFDQLFYSSEQAGLPPLYMGGAMIIDASASPYKLTAGNVAAHLAARLEKIPLMRKKIVRDPLKIGKLRLVDDPGFEARKHITTTTVSKPGGYKELTECLGAFSSQRMDLTRPPWHYEVIAGLEGGRLAIAMHLHHSVIDGLGALDALSSIFDMKPVKPQKPSKRNWRVEQEPVPFALLSSALLENAERVFVKTPSYIKKSGLPLTRVLATKLFGRMKPQDKPDDSAYVLPKVRRTSLNPETASFKRVVSYVEFPLSDAYAIRKHFNCSINDLALMLNSCALDYYFRRIGEKVDFDLVNVMPMNARKHGEKTAGNVLTISRVNLHNTIRSLPTRLKTIAQDTARIKSQQRSADGPSLDGRSLMDLFSPWVVDGLCYAMARLNLAGKVLIGNVAVTNVPGSPVQLYLAGAPLLTAVPMAPVLGAGVALTVTVSSTDRFLLLGYHGDGEAIKDKELFVAGAHQAFAKLLGLATRSDRRGGRPSGESTKPVRKPRQRERAPAIAIQAQIPHQPVSRSGGIGNRNQKGSAESLP